MTDTEIKIGQTMPYSGPASALSVAGRAQAAYLNMINDRGGINGRKIKLISLDDSYNPTKTVEHTRQLVEGEQVLLIFSPLGTAPNMAIYKYLNAKKVPHLFVSSVASRWNDPAHLPWTMMTFRPSFEIEARTYAEYILQTRPNAKIGVLYQNDEMGKDYLKGLREGLGARTAQMLVSEQSHELTDATVDSQVIALKASGADVLLTFTTPKFGAQTIRKVHDLGWKPLHIVGFPASAIKAVLEPAGLDKSIGLMSSSVTKDPADPQWRDDAGIKEYLAIMKRYYPDGDVDDWSNVGGFTTRPAARPCAEAVWRRPHARERDAAGGQHPGSRAAPAAARHPRQHEQDGLPAGRPDSVDTLRRQALGTHRRAHRGEVRRS